ncbi:MAG: hypothetical protein ACLFTU_11600, partial [Puniceicoccaceae bacterium]
DHGFLYGTARKEGTDNRHAVLLLKADIIPDWNRDGVIDDTDRNRVTRDNPFRFWTNADADASDDAMGASPPEDVTSTPANPFPANGQDAQVNGYRDLVDFFPLQLDLAEILELLPPEDFEYRLSHADGMLRFFYPGLKPEDAGELHRKLYDPASHNPFGFSFAGPWDSAETRLVPPFDGTTNGVKLEEAFLNAISSEDAGLLAFEGVPENQGSWSSDEPLVLHIVAKADGAEIAQVSFPLRISPVSDMYRTLNLRGSDSKFTRSSDADISAWMSLVDLVARLFGKGLAENHPGRSESLTEPSNLPDFYYSAAKPTSPHGFTFVHGYAWNGDEAGWGYDEVFKRFFQTGMNAPFLGVFWRGDESQIGADSRTTPDYPENEINALVTAPHLAERLPAQFQGGQSVIMAHSLGTVVISSAITEHGLDVGSAILMNSAASREAFGHPVGTYPGTVHQDERFMTARDSFLGLNHSWRDFSFEPDGGGFQYKPTNRALASEWFRNFEGTDDARGELTWRDKFTNFAGTAFYNYYSSGEQVLRNPVDDEGEEFSDGRLAWGMLFKGGEGAWVFNQRTKGTLTAGVATNDRHGGWGFNGDDTWDPRQTGSPQAHWMVERDAAEDWWTPMFPGELDDAFAALDPGELADRLVETPFFRPFAHTFHGPGGNAEDPDIFPAWGDGHWLYAPVGDPAASALAADLKNHAKILAEAIPARSYAVGRNEVAEFNLIEKRNFDMQDSEFFRGTEAGDDGEWPDRSGPSANRWLHGDYMAPVLCYVYRLYENVIEKGDLK